MIRRSRIALFVLLHLGFTAGFAAKGFCGASIFPSPAEFRPGIGRFEFTKTTTIHCHPDSRSNAALLQAVLQEVGISAPIAAGGIAAGAPYIAIAPKGESTVLKGNLPDTSREPGAFSLSVTAKRVYLRGADSGGELYGILCLLQMVDRNMRAIPVAAITDRPYMGFRGLRGHFPKNDPEEIARFKNIIRAMAFCRLNQLWIRDLYVRRFPATIRWDSHPEIADPDAISKQLAGELIEYAGRYNVKVMGSISSTADMIWSIHPELIEMGPGEHPATVPIRNETGRTHKYRFGARFNLCPSQQATYDLLFNLIDEISELFTSDVIDLGIDEVSQPENGSRWAADMPCRGKDPVRLFADYTNRLADHVIAKGKTPLVNSTPFIRQHGGDYLDLYRSVDRIRKEVLVNNWSEKIARQRSWFLDLTRFSSEAYFKRHGLENVIHMTGAQRRWRDRPDLREPKGRIDGHGAFITHYAYMTGEDGVRAETIDDMAFSGQHFWTPNQPEIDSDEDKSAVDRSKGVISRLLVGDPFSSVVPNP